MNRRRESQPGIPYVHPDAAALAEAVLEIGRHLHLEMAESDLIERFLGVVARLLPDRAIAVRIVDPRSIEAARGFATGAELRASVGEEPITLRESAITGSGMKSAVAASARVRIAPRWDSPFHHVAQGFSVPLVAAGELYGALDVGYHYRAPDGALGGSASDAAAAALPADEKVILPLANQLAVALRGHQLFRESLRLRDFTAGLIEHANALIVGIDARWRITVCNQAMLTLTGFAREEVLGRDLRDFLPRDQRTVLTRTFQHALRGGSTDAVDVHLSIRNGERRHTVWSIAAIGARNSIDAVIAIGQDHSRLDHLQKQVIQAERLATLGQLAAGVVHELNNPLTSITVYARYLLGKAAKDPDVPVADRQKLERILGSAQRILTFTRELVQYAKPVGSELDAIEVNDVVRTALSFCEHLFERSEVDLILDLGGDLPALHAVPGQLEQILINLVTNAAHAIDTTGVVAVRTRRYGREVSIEVADSGPGVPEPDRERIFEPFFTTKTDGKGTGLGLPIVRNIVEQHQGRISVGSAPEGGASFTVFLPIS